MCGCVEGGGLVQGGGVVECVEENKSSHNCTRRLTHLELPLFGSEPQSTLLLKK